MRGREGVRDEKRYGRWGNNTFSGAKRGLEYRKTPLVCIVSIRNVGIRRRTPPRIARGRRCELIAAFSNHLFTL